MDVRFLYIQKTLLLSVVLSVNSMATKLPMLLSLQLKTDVRSLESMIQAEPEFRRELTLFQDMVRYSIIIL